MKRTSALLLAVFFAAVPSTVLAQSFARFGDHVIFDNSPSSGYDPYSSGNISAPSTLKLVQGKLPLETAEFVSGPNALELAWTSAPNGGWDAQIRAIRWRNADLQWTGNTLSFWLWSPEPIVEAALPRIALADADGGHTVAAALQTFTGDLPAHTWRRVHVPLASLHFDSLHPFNAAHLESVLFSQSNADNKSHTVYVDEIRIDDGDAHATSAPAAPTGLKAKGL